MRREQLNNLVRDSQWDKAYSNLACMLYDKGVVTKSEWGILGLVVMVGKQSWSTSLASVCQDKVGAEQARQR